LQKYGLKKRFLVSVLSLLRAVGNGFEDVGDSDFGRGVEIGDGAGQFYDFVIAPGGEVEGFG